MSLVLTVEAVVGNAEVFTPSNRVSWIFRYPTVVQAQLVRPERSFDVAGGSGSNLAGGGKKKKVCQDPDSLP